jgi:phosphohistidine swiveling domain-containing protein
VTGQVLDVRRRFLRRQASEAAEFLDRRELTKAATLQLGGLVRRCHLEFGRRLVERGRLETVDDVELLGIDEMEIVCDAPGPSLQTIARRRQLHREQLQAPALPLRWTGLPPLTRTDDVSGERFEGWSASPGRYEGTARVVVTPGSTEFHRGEVLVATTTDASWTPLFMAAGAIVVEQGGPLSHAAIVARELGLPTVVNVPGFVARLEHEGGTAPVVVDGTAGVVTVRSDTSPDASEGQSTEQPTEQSTDAASIRTAAYAPARVADAKWDDSRLPTNVFVAGLMGASALLSIVIGLTESISSTRGRDRLRRRATPIARTSAEGVVDGYDTVAASAVGLRARRDYVLAAIILVLLGLALGARATDVYLTEDGSSLTWALTIASAVTLLLGGVVLAVSLPEWPSLPSVVRRIAPGYPVDGQSLWSSISHPARVAIGVMVSLVALGALFVAFAEPLVLEIDRRVYFDVLHAGRQVDWIGPDVFIELGHVIPITVIAVVVSLIVWMRSRALALAYPLLIATAGAIFLGLNWLVHRSRPPLSAHFGQHTSYPGGHSIQVAIVLLSLPLVVWALTRNRVLRVLGIVVPVGIWALTETNVVRTGGHWPVDQTAGLLIAASLLTVFYSYGIAALRRERDEATSLSSS